MSHEKKPFVTFLQYWRQQPASKSDAQIRAEWAALAQAHGEPYPGAPEPPAPDQDQDKKTRRTPFARDPNFDYEKYFQEEKTLVLAAMQAGLPLCAAKEKTKQGRRKYLLSKGPDDDPYKVAEFVILRMRDENLVAPTYDPPGAYRLTPKGRKA
jgi:hypothetical protein